MQLDVGKIYEGKVTGITKFGAFVEIEPGVTGMVHISEVANTFVSEIKDHLTDGQQVKVKVLSIGDDGKISLSIKKAADNPPPQQKRNLNNNRPNNGGNNNRRFDNNKSSGYHDKTSVSPEAAFEDMLNKFKQNSEERMSDLKRNIEGKRKNTKRKG
jgi:S1 RNA binding domain protein